MKDLKDLITHSFDIESKIGYAFKDKSLLALAFVHKSYVNEHRDITSEHNERLEFLGDSVLGILIVDYLYRYLPSTSEGDLSHLRSCLVDASACMRYVQELDVEEYLLLGKGERFNNGRGRDSILSDLFEAIIGAIYLDGGIEAAKNFLFKNFSSEINVIMTKPIRNWKADLQDYSQKKHKCPPEYSIIEESGPDHSKRFIIAVAIDGEEVGRGSGPSKKEAQQSAAEDAINSVISDQ
ncbi:MAG: ribonuclease III [Waddliaceae bacterium]|jgi:ribonuclease III|nr:ribonuclease III [Waddliaceae bacterium]MBT3579422.1 ribonuclease III [Waddliaceae bacterium]MBT4445175.1 ribonuclease III [Waddliaceae bacterium]MBT6928160.1 ribonuclease III [Waddliaceae bacterium]MBT7264493.1 ribonuclease III [Waddliaceae bacterium]